MTDSEVLAKITARWETEARVTRGDVDWLLAMATRAIPPWDDAEPSPEIMDALRKARP